jgi:hypothetical protein
VLKSQRLQYCVIATYADKYNGTQRAFCVTDKWVSILSSGVLTTVWRLSIEIGVGGVEAGKKKKAPTMCH